MHKRPVFKPAFRSLEFQTNVRPSRAFQIEVDWQPWTTVCPSPLRLKTQTARRQAEEARVRVGCRAVKSENAL